MRLSLLLASPLAADAGCTVGKITCYVDAGARVLDDGDMLQRDPLSQEYCAQVCSDQNHSLAGVESSNQCFCGDTLKEGTQVAPDSDCGTPCAHHPGQSCGGSWRIGVFDVDCSGDPVPPPQPPPPTLNFLSATFGSHMVLQREPQQAVLFGNTSPGAVITTHFDGQSFTAAADVNGTWRQRLPATPASKTAYNLTFSSSSGEAASLSDVLFGDVYICGGQSNMQFSMPATTNASAEIQLADNYPTIRLFTVGQDTSSSVPIADLQTIEQIWSVASSHSIAGNGGFGYFSSVCWFFGRQISDSLSPSGDVPIGLVSNNWGGTSVEQWSTPEAFASCGRSGSGNLYNAMIHPYTVGPMAISGFTWYQGEANTRNQQSADDYACLFPAMISEWRKAFRSPSAYFGFVQLSTWCGGGIPEMREAQMAALKLPMVAYATNADYGAGCNIHPPTKQFCGKRLGDAALALQYGNQIQWRSPSYASATPQVGSATVSVTVSLADVSASGLTTDVFPANYVKGLNCTGNANCAWAGIEVDGAGWLNATVSANPGGKLVLEAALPSTVAAGAAILASSYGWGPIPLMNAYDAGTNLPVLPWKKSIAEAAMVV